MLTLTDNAAAVIRDLAAAPQVPDGSGLRIAADPAAGALTVTLMPEPQAGDEILNVGGARVFLDSDAAPLLADKQLDAAVDGDGAVQFSVDERSD